MRNSDNSVTTSIKGYATCLAAEKDDGASRIYSLNTLLGGGTNQGSDGTRAGTYQGLATLLSFGSGAGGCLNDAGGYFSPLLGGWFSMGAPLIGTGPTNNITAASAITQEIWFMTTSKQGQIMGFGENRVLPDTAPAKKGLQVFLTSSGQLDFATYNGSNEELIPQDGINYADGKWHQVVAVYDAGSKRLYVDGSLRASATQQRSESFTGYWRLGYDTLDGWTNPPSGYFTGSMQYAALYTKALTAGQVRAHYLAGTH